MTETKKNKPEEMKFEEAYSKLQAVVEKLETGSLPLEESMALFKEGKQLSKYCDDLLNQAELTIKTIPADEAEKNNDVE